MSPFIDLYSFTKMYFADVVFPVRCQHLRFRQGEVSSKFCWCHHDEGRYPSCGCNLPIKTICSLSTKRWLRCRNPEAAAAQERTTLLQRQWPAPKTSCTTGNIAWASGSWRPTNRFEKDRQEHKEKNSHNLPPIIDGIINLKPPTILHLEY